MSDKLEKSEEKWEKDLSPEQYAILRKKDTEMPFTGKYVYEKKDGIYHCAACGNPLFSSQAKFDSGTGWPSFDQSLVGAVEYHKDESGGVERTEVVCARCGSHLGHVFDDGPQETTGKRFCLNSLSLDLKEKKEKGENI